MTVALIVVAFTLRWLWGKYRARVHQAFSVIAVYLELLWIYLSATLIADGIGMFTGWVATRQGTVWLGEFKASVSEWFTPITTIWDSLVVVLGIMAKATLEPLAWLTIAGVIYGQAIAAAAPAIHDMRAAKVRENTNRCPRKCANASLI